MMYDVDGEAAQDEFATAYMADGLYGYQRGTLMTATQNSDNVRFKGPGADQSETDTDGAFLLYYANTSSVNILMESMLDSGTNNPVFSALDGDQSMTMTGTFTTLAEVPAPGAVTLIGLAGVLCGRRRRN
jgi:MYXO-CTERM domain-containing protein